MPTQIEYAPVEMPTDGDAQPGTGAAARLRRDLEGAALERDGVVPADDPLLLVTEDLLEIDAPERHEGTGADQPGAQLNVAL